MTPLQRIKRIPQPGIRSQLRLLGIQKQAAEKSDPSWNVETAGHVFEVFQMFPTGGIGFDLFGGHVDVGGSAQAGEYVA